MPEIIVVSLLKSLMISTFLRHHSDNATKINFMEYLLESYCFCEMPETHQ